MTFTIAIVGRPNVGKSTLFNRLAGKRLALVDPTPGLTRDRREAETELAGVPVRLIDTAGLEESEPGSISERMRQQTSVAIRDADLVLFVIDARAGVVPADEVFADLVRRSGERVLLLANKAEGKAGDSGFYDAYSLGLGDPIAISAEHGEGIGDLIADVLAIAAPPAEEDDEEDGDADAPEPQAEDGDAPAPDDPEQALKIAVVGRPNAGKSTLVNAILGSERMITGPEPGLTRDTISIEHQWKGRKLRLYDTAGLRRKARIEERAEQIAVSDTLRAIRFAEVVVLLIDAGRPFEKQDLIIGDLVADEGRAMVIGINKWDLVEDKQKTLKELREDLERYLPQVKDIALVPLSATSGAGVGKLLDAAVAAYEVWNKRVSTSALNRWLIDATERHAPPAASGRRIRLRFATQPNARPPTFVAFCSKPESLPKSYLRYLVNSLREAFDLPGTPIRFHLRKGDNPYAGKKKF